MALRSVAPYFSKIVHSASLGSPKTRKRPAEPVIVLQCIDSVLAPRETRAQQAD